MNYFSGSMFSLSLKFLYKTIAKVIGSNDRLGLSRDYREFMMKLVIAPLNRGKKNLFVRVVLVDFIFLMGVIMF